MNKIEFSNELHDFFKTNLITLRDRAGVYDTYTCNNCGIQAKRYGLDSHVITIKKYALMKVNNCNSTEDTYVGRRIRITNFGGSGPAFENIINGGIHRIISPPKEEANTTNGSKGVWVMGVGEPIHVLFHEFIFKPPMKRRNPIK